jgi:LDH2 family malate/lactate/ureidoglycolate dehydrogenase
VIQKLLPSFMAAELRGHSSHGMIRIKDYFQLWKAGRINVSPSVRIIHESPSTAVVDGNNAVGMVAAGKSMEIAIEKAGMQVRDGWRQKFKPLRHSRLLCHDGPEA